MTFRYLEECSSTLATTYSSGTPGQDASIVTVDQVHKDDLDQLHGDGAATAAIDDDDGSEDDDGDDEEEDEDDH